MGYYKLKKTIKVKGKKIIFEINFERYYKELEKLRHNVLKRKTRHIQDSIETLKEYDSVLELSSKEICLKSCKLLIKNFVNTISEFISYVIEPFYIHINLLSFERHYIHAEIIKEISTFNNFFLDFGSYYLFSNYLVDFFKGNLPVNLKKEHAFSEKLLLTLEHEFVHFIDLEQLKNRVKIFERFRGKLDRRFGEAFGQFSQLRSEGLADIISFRRKKYLPYSKTEIEKYKEGFDWGKHGDATYYLGVLMHYFIGLYFLYKKRINEFNNMRAYFNNREYWTFKKGINNILNKTDKEILLQNLPEDIIRKILKETREWSHIKFLKKYEEACEKLNIENKNQIFILKDYNKVKKHLYKEWKDEVKKHNFSV